MRKLRRGLLVVSLTLFFGFALFFARTVSAAAQAGACISLDQNENTFSCSVTETSTWGIDGDGGIQCAVNHEPDLAVCSGNFPGTLVCGQGETSCCVPCRPILEEDQTLSYGESCSPGDLCENGTTCRSGRCLRPVGTIGFGVSCLHTSECGTGTLTNDMASLVCEEGVCLDVSQVADPCSSDQECKDRVGRDNVICNLASNECQDIILPGDEREEDVEEEDSTPILPFSFCDQVPVSQRSGCEACYEEAGVNEGRVYTAVGCIRTSGRGLTEDLVRLLMGISGGISLLSILAGAFLYTTSQGDSSKLKEAKALITAAVSGMFFIIFSIFILQFLGVSILRIPGLAGGTTAGGGQPQSPQDCATEGSPATADRGCCSGLIGSGPSSICRQPQFLVDGGFYIFDDDQSTQFCTLGADEEYMQAVSLTSADVSCANAINGMSCNTFSSIVVPTTLGATQTRSGGLYRCTGAVEVSSPVQNAFSSYLATTLGSENSSQYRVYVEERVIGAVRYYDVHVMIEPTFWETLPQSVRDEISSGPQLQLAYNATWGGTVAGTEVSRDTSYSGYATLLLQVVSFAAG